MHGFLRYAARASEVQHHVNMDDLVASLLADIHAADAALRRLAAQRGVSELAVARARAVQRNRLDLLGRLAIRGLLAGDVRP